MAHEEERVLEEQQIVVFRRRLSTDAALRARYIENPQGVLERDSSLSPRVRWILAQLPLPDPQGNYPAPPRSAWMP